MPQYFDSTAARPMKTKRSVYAKGGRAGYYGGGRTNLLEELGRVEARPSNPNRAKALAKTFKKMGRERKSA